MGARLTTNTQVKRVYGTRTIVTDIDNWLPIMVPPANGGVETEQSGEKGFAKAHKNQKRRKQLMENLRLKVHQSC